MPSINWYLNRLSLMSVPEVGFRTLRHTRGVFERLGIGIVRHPPNPDLERLSNAHTPHGSTDQFNARIYAGAADRILAGYLDIFSLKGFRHGPSPAWNTDPLTGTAAPLDFGKSLDYRNSDIVGDIKYLWEPNRHLHLVTVAQAYHLTGDSKYLDFIIESIASWIQQCPYLRGPNWCSSLELAIRLINWTLVWNIVGGRAAFQSRDGGADFCNTWLQSVYQHCHFISTHFSGYSSAGNHLIGEAAGLYCAAHTWNVWAATSEWKSNSKKILIQEAARQVHNDGVTKEQAISYQQFVLDFLIYSAIYGHLRSDPFPASYWRTIHAMIKFIGALMDSSGNVPMIGDADDGYVFRLSPFDDFCPFKSLVATGAIIFHDPFLESRSDEADEKSRWLLGDSRIANDPEIPEIKTTTFPREFPDGGYYFMGRNLGDSDEIRLVADCGPLGLTGLAGHGHADALSVYLSVNGKEILVDPGTYAYHTKRLLRDYFRGTSAHNTLRIDNTDQSLSGGTFMWLKHAQVRCLAWDASNGEQTLVGQHDGYTRLKPPAVHQRTIHFSSSDTSITIEDKIISNGHHDVELFWHLAENCEVMIDGSTAVITRDDVIVRLSIATPSTPLIVANGDEKTPLGWVSRSFDVKTASNSLIARLSVEGNQTIKTLIAIKTGECP